MVNWTSIGITVLILFFIAVEIANFALLSKMEEHLGKINRRGVRKK